VAATYKVLNIIFRKLKHTFAEPEVWDASLAAAACLAAAAAAGGGIEPPGDGDDQPGLCKQDNPVPA
jgi:hypothetical protein